MLRNVLAIQFMSQAAYSNRLMANNRTVEVEETYSFSPWSGGPFQPEMHLKQLALHRCIDIDTDYLSAIAEGELRYGSVVVDNSNGGVLLRQTVSATFFCSFEEEDLSK